jgi:uncharacterized cupredoxin-like copper-binding protein
VALTQLAYQAHPPNGRCCHVGGSPQILLRKTLVVLATAPVVLLLAACGTGAPVKPANGAIAAVTEGDFAITAPTQLKAGNVLLRVHNNGPEEHELIVVRVRDPRLPFRPDGFTVDEEAIQHSEPGSLVPGQPGSTRDLRIDLKPGSYVLFCNMAGHYLGGMHSNLVVTQ